MRLIAGAKTLAKRHWPMLSLRTILFATFLFVAALPGFGAVFLRVYENTLVQQTEAELIAQGAVLSAAYRAAWGGPRERRGPPVPERPQIDLRVDPVLPPAGLPVRAGPGDPRAQRVGGQLEPMLADASAVTLAATHLLDRRGVVVAGGDAKGLSYAALPEVRQALRGRTATTLRRRGADQYGLSSPLELVSRAVSLRVHHVRPIVVRGEVVGAVMLSRSPRGLFLGIYQDRGKIILGVLLIVLTLIVLAGLLSRGIARPIRALTAASENVASGTVGIPEPPATAAIEIRELYVNFAIMAERIELRTRYLRDFAAAVSHEFKTPLTGIRGALELLAEHGGEMDEEERCRFLANATADADRLSRLVQRLLDLARADMASGAGDPACDPVAVARECADQLGHDDITVLVEAPQAIPQARISPDALTAVLATLFDNSRQAGATQAKAAFTRDEGKTMISVTDDGKGIDPADSERVFEPFFTGNRARGGTGLGLPIAQSLLSATGGNLLLEPSASGAKFVITLRDLPQPSGS